MSEQLRETVQHARFLYAFVENDLIKQPWRGINKELKHLGNKTSLITAWLNSIFSHFSFYILIVSEPLLKDWLKTVLYCEIL